jgi:hypothetical protein
MNIDFTFTFYITTIFVSLKLTHVIDWSWWWVLSPTIFVALLFFFLIFVLGKTVRRN